MASSATWLEVDIELPLDRFSLSVKAHVEASALGVFGASGAGKTSLLEVVAGLRQAGRGRVVCRGETWLDSEAGIFLPPEQRRLGYVPQDGLLFPHWDVRRNLLAGSRRLGADVEKTFDETVELLELGALLGRSVTSLSGGERQRVALGRALCSGPTLLLLDEPMASLDLGLRRRLLPFLERVRAELTVPMLLVSHDPLEVQALCDELLVLSRGGVLAQGEPRRVLTDPSVFPLASQQGFENVLSGTIRRHGESLSRVGLDAGTGGEVELLIPRCPIAENSDVLLSVPANDIVLAVERPRGISTRNILEGRIASIRRSGPAALVDVELGVLTTQGRSVATAGATLSVEVTASTPEELGLEAGRVVFLLIKATSCRIYGG